MSIDIKVTVDATEVQKLLAQLDPDALIPRVAEAIADDVVLPALSEERYPPQSGKPMQWASERQRRFVMASIRSGAIEVPYRRSGAFGNSFEKNPTPDGMDVTSHLNYAAYVRGPGQAAYHKGNWDTLDELAEQLEDKAGSVAGAVIQDEIDKV